MKPPKTPNRVYGCKSCVYMGGEKKGQGWNARELEVEISSEIQEWLRPRSSTSVACMLFRMHEEVRFNMYTPPYHTKGLARSSSVMLTGGPGTSACRRIMFSCSASAVLLRRAKRYRSFFAALPPSLRTSWFLGSSGFLLVMTTSFLLRETGKVEL